jgi:hypothetical protein
MKVLKNRRLMKACGSKGQEVTAGSRHLENEAHHDLLVYTTSNVIRFVKGDEMGVACDIYEIEEKFSQGFGEET